MKRAGLVAAALLVRPAGAIAGTLSPARDYLTYSEATWRTMIGEQLRVDAAGGPRLKLRTVTSFPPPALGGQCFGLIFDGPIAPSLSGGTYRMYHAKLGWFSLFLTTGSLTGQSRSYGAIVNRLPA